MKIPEPSIHPRLRRGEYLDRRTFRGNLEHFLRYIGASFFGILFFLLLFGIPSLLVLTST